MKKGEGKKPKRQKDVILLQDLAPRKEVTGGAGQLLFGQATHLPEVPKKKDGSKP